jgi:hypothetical protein
VLDAIWIWSQFPRQIASDLSQYHHRRIAEWHQGDMSSYELLELLEHMPERGAFKTAARGGEYSEEEITLRHLANEVARLRATMHAVYGQRYDPPLLMTKAEQREQLEDLEETSERREDFFSLVERSSAAKVSEASHDDGLDWDGVS